MQATAPKRLHPRSARLLRPADFAELRRLAKRLSLPHLRCEYRPNDCPSARLGMAVSRQVSKLAVQRNRIRRQIRESFRLHRGDLPSVDLLVIVRASAVELSNARLRAELEQLWRKLILSAGAAAPVARDC